MTGGAEVGRWMGEGASPDTLLQASDPFGSSIRI
jgi:hypothetical protein